VRRDIARLAAIVAASTALALATNALSARPVPILSARGPGAWPEREPRVTAEALRSALASGRPPLLLDARSEEAFRLSRPAGAVHVPYERLAGAYGALAQTLREASSVVVLCENESCPSADRAARLLAELGHANVAVLHGGWEAYRAAGLPVREGAP
jgi:thiosulfate/3-mercaptopyruvate sulfurtransferase